jgi:hypothetical protein
MTLDGRNAGGTSGDAERDARLDRLYHEAGGDTPPARLDAAILAAAHREAGARPRPVTSTLRRWSLPVSIAAVVALSVSLVTLVHEEGGDRLTEIPPVTPLPTLERKATPPVPEAKEEAGREDRSAQRQPERPAPAVSTPALATPEPFPGRRQEQRPHQAAGVAPPQAGTPALPDLLAKPAPLPSTRAHEEAAVDLRGMAAESAFTPDTRPSAAQAPARAAAGNEAAATAAGRAVPSAPPAPPSKAAISDLGRSMEPGGATPQPPIWQDLERQPPEKWLERMEELRRTGRTVELKDLLAEFRKRFPGHTLPAWIR